MEPFFDPNRLLSIACRKNNISLVKRLLERGIDPNKKDEFGYTALHSACSVGNLELINLLLEYNANPNVRDNYNTTVLDIVYSYNTHAAPIMKCLLEYGFDMSVYFHRQKDIITLRVLNDYLPVGR
jgi:ankyrin repeat protein